ncbi:hypothetical protein KDN32_08385 [Nocardioides sp. J2M5]|uniref:hypothetical protein n=1 Tax=Nocardioides palaemonis TaxID=2829810 RepID=UPI001BA8D598|nr:hypothetical protein [Nocardioides palaemonis]MBS2937759.1 hypothetical protein [Nocardioides palaemonis]
MMTFLGLGPGRDFVLLALPKTASTTLERTLAPHATEVVGSPPGQKHLPARGFVHTRAHALAEQGHPRDSYELVTMFREPLAWLESWWRYRAREDSRQSTAEMTFDEFARRYLAGDDDAPVPKGRPAKFIRAQGGVAVDRIFAVDRPDVWEPWFSARVGAPLAFERRNASTAERGELADPTREALVAHFEPEYAVWRRLEETGEWAGARGTRLDQ